MNIQKLSNSLVVVALLVTACASAQPGSPTIQPTDLPPAQPAITLNPTSGGPETTVNVTGAGFPAGETIGFYLGIPNAGASPDAMAKLQAAPDGSFSAIFPLPSAWPDGRPITEPTLVIIAANPDFSVKATAEFALKVLPQ